MFSQSNYGGRFGKKKKGKRKVYVFGIGVCPVLSPLCYPCSAHSVDIKREFATICALGRCDLIGQWLKLNSTT